MLMLLCSSLLPSWPQVQWPSVIWVAEAKQTLEVSDEYEEALGRVSDRARTLFNQQRQQRRHVIAAVLGCNSMEVLFIPRSAADKQVVRTSRVALLQSGDSPYGDASPAAQLLLRLFSSPAAMFGYHASIIPPPMCFTSISGQTLQLHGFECLRASMADVYGSAFSGVYQAKLGDGSAVAVKFGAKDAIDQEVGARVRTVAVQKVPRHGCTVTWCAMVHLPFTCMTLDVLATCAVLAAGIRPGAAEQGKGQPRPRAAWSWAATWPWQLHCDAACWQAPVCSN